MRHQGVAHHAPGSQDAGEDALGQVGILGQQSEGLHGDRRRETRRLDHAGVARSQGWGEGPHQ